MPSGAKTLPTWSKSSMVMLHFSRISGVISMAAKTRRPEPCSYTHLHFSPRWRRCGSRSKQVAMLHGIVRQNASKCPTRNMNGGERETTFRHTLSRTCTVSSLLLWYFLFTQKNCAMEGAENHRCYAWDIWSPFRVSLFLGQCHEGLPKSADP